MQLPNSATINSVEYAGFDPAEFRGARDQFALHQALRKIARGKLSFDKMVVLHRVVSRLTRIARSTARLRETDISLPNNQRQHRTSHAPKNVLP